MIVISRFTVEYDEDQGNYKIKNLEAPLCPDCGQILTGYDTRSRHVVASSGASYEFKLRRLKCKKCNRLHVELPDFMQPNKHYEAQLINDVIAGLSDHCPADDSTIRRWRNKKSPPGSPFNSR